MENMFLDDKETYDIISKLSVLWRGKQKHQKEEAANWTKGQVLKALTHKSEAVVEVALTSKRQRKQNKKTQDVIWRYMNIHNVFMYL